MFGGVPQRGVSPWVGDLSQSGHTLFGATAPLRRFTTRFCSSALLPFFWGRVPPLK